MTFDSTYAEYRWLRKQNGWCDELRMIRSVWDGCDPDSQENMLEQFRASLREKDRYIAQHGEVW